MINTTVDAFGTIVTVGDIVAVLVPLQYSNTRFKHFGKAKVVKCTPNGATVQIGKHKFNRKSELMVLLEEAQFRSLYQVTPYFGPYDKPEITCENTSNHTMNQKEYEEYERERMEKLKKTEGFHFNAKECLRCTLYEGCEMAMGGQVNTKEILPDTSGEILNVNPDRLPKIDDSEFKGDNK